MCISKEGTLARSIRFDAFSLAIKTRKSQNLFINYLFSFFETILDYYGSRSAKAQKDAFVCLVLQLLLSFPNDYIIISSIDFSACVTIFT